MAEPRLVAAVRQEGDHDGARMLLAASRHLHGAAVLLSELIDARPGDVQGEGKISEPFSAVALAPDHLRAPLVGVMSDLLGARYQEALAAGSPLLVKIPDNPLLL